MDIWSGVLDLKHVGAGDNFFDLGGDSLLLAAVHARLHKEMNVDIPITDLFEFPTVRSLARRLTSTSPGSPRFDEAAQRAQKQRAAFARKHEGRMRGRS